jgi:tetratricopeptide (TPR) repeat protein
MASRKWIVLILSILGFITLIDRLGDELMLNQMSISNTHLGFARNKLGHTFQDSAIEFPQDRSYAARLYAHSLYQFGLMYKFSGRDDLALDAFHAARESAPGNLIAYLNEGQILSATGRLDQAIAVWRQGNVESYFLSLGTHALNNRDLPAAETNLKIAIQINTDDYIPYTRLGSVYRLSKDWEQAREAYQRALALKPDDLDANYHMGVTFLALGQILKAREYANKALELDPNYVWSYILLGDTYRVEKDYVNAEKWYRTTQDIAQGANLAFKYLGLTALEKKDSIDALRYFSQITPYSDDVSNSERHWLIGRAYVQDGQYMAGLLELETALQLEPDNIAYGLELATVYETMKQISAARAIYLHILQIEPDNLPATLGLTKLAVEN